MARIRTIKPDFFISDTVSALPLRARLTWIGLWTHCDDYGRCRDNVKLIKAAVWPLDDVSLRDVASDLDDLEKANVVFRYLVEGKGYIQITNWAEHQKVDRPSKSAIPPPSNGTRETLASPRDGASNPRAGKGEEGNGGEGTRDARANPPPSRCRQHLDEPDPPPCGGCADARRARNRWEADRARQLAAAPKCAKHRGQPADNCAICRSEQLARPDEPDAPGPS
jgi:hypothetical protein